MAFVPSEFNVASYSSQLIELTANAAGTIIDKIQKRSPYEADSIKGLADLLQKTAEDIDRAEPIGVQVLWQTLRRYRGNERIQNTNELAQKVYSVAQELRNFTNSTKRKLRFLREFCINLCDDITAYCPSVF